MFNETNISQILGTVVMERVSLQKMFENVFPIKL